MSTQTMLPESFTALEPFAVDWALTGSAARAARRGSSTAEERQAFYAAAAGELPRALDYLDGKGFDAFDAADERLRWSSKRMPSHATRVIGRTCRSRRRRREPEGRSLPGTIIPRHSRLRRNDEVV